MKKKYIHSSNQTNEFETESYRYIKSHSDTKIRNISLQKKLIPKSIPKNKVNSICDIGCGNGEMLRAWKSYFNLEKAVGVEPSKKGINILKKKFLYEKINGLDFVNAYAHKLPFETDFFDIVLVWSTLHWIGRNEYLQSLGEIIRVCGKFLVIMDFVAKENYRVPYHHKGGGGLFTYKHDFEKIIVESAIMSPIERTRHWVDPLDKKIKILKEKQLAPFTNYINYHSRKIVVFKKDYNLLKIRTENEFKK
jgi:ubiquinone/menaquinone biosynthesis C-methylase UbiE